MPRRKRQVYVGRTSSYPSIRFFTIISISNHLIRSTGLHLTNSIHSLDTTKATMQYYIAALALSAIAYAAPVDRRQGNVVSDVTANTLSATSEGVDALGNQVSNIVAQVASSDNDESITSQVADNALPKDQDSIDDLTNALGLKRRQGNVVSDVTGNTIDATSEGVDALGDQVSNIADQVASAGNEESITSQVADNALPKDQDSINDLTDALGLKRRQGNVVSDVTGNTIDATSEGVDALGDQVSNIVDQVASSDNDESITSQVAENTLPTSQENVNVLTDVLGL